MLSSFQNRFQQQNLRKLLSIDSFIKATVFGCAGTTCMLTMPTIMIEYQKMPPLTYLEYGNPYFGDNPSLRDGPWLYRLLYACTSIVVYNFSLVFWGCVFMRGNYFLNFTLRMWSRIFP